jgi:hypothetical protein
MDGHGRLAHDTNVERGDHPGMFWAAAIKKAAYDQETISMLSSVLERAVAALPLKQRGAARREYHRDEPDATGRTCQSPSARLETRRPLE